MRWLRRDKWKVSIVIAGLLLLLIFMVWVPVSAAGTYERASDSARPGTLTLQTPSAADLTVTAVVQDQLKQQDEKARRDNSFPWTLLNAIGGSILIAAAAIISTIIGFSQWRGNRNDERRKEIAAQDKELRAQAEERFKTAVTALGDKNEATQVGGAILLRSFLNPEDEEIYARYYNQIFDLAVAYLRLPNTHQAVEDPEEVPTSPKDPSDPLSLTPLRQALISIFREVCPLARSQNEQDPLFLDARDVQLDNAYLANADLEHVQMPKASLRNATLTYANLRGANLTEANLAGADLLKSNFSEANLWQADLSGTRLIEADLSGAFLRDANFTRAKLGAVRGILAYYPRDDETGIGNRRRKFNGAILNDAHLTGAIFRDADLSFVKLTGAELNKANLRGANLKGANLEDVLSLKDTDLRRVKGLTKEQLEACKARGAIVDEDTTTSLHQPTVSPSPSSRSNNAQVPSAPLALGSTRRRHNKRRKLYRQTPSPPPAQVNTPPPSTDAQRLGSDSSSC